MPGVVVTVLSALAQLPGRAGPPALPIERVRAMLARADAGIDSLRVVYEAQDSNQPIGFKHRRVHCTKRPAFFFHELSHADPSQPFGDDPVLKQNYLTYQSGYTYFPFSRLYNETARFRRGGRLPWQVFGTYFMATGLWPLDYWAPPRWHGRQAMGLKELAAEKDLVLRPRQEFVNGRWCHVLVHGERHVTWVDMDRQGCVVAREMRAPDGALVLRFDLGGHVRHDPGVWLPSWIRQTLYDTSARLGDARAAGPLLGNYTMTEVAVNGMDEAFFRFQPPPGAVRDENGRLTQTGPGGEDLIDEMAEWIRRYYYTPSGSGGERARLYGAACVLLISMIGCEVWWRRRRGGIGSDALPSTAPGQGVP